MSQLTRCAPLLDALGLAPAVVFGTSSGGIFALATVQHHPEAARAAILHEPALFTLFDDPHGARTTVTKVVADGMQEGGPATAFERFIRLVATDDNWERLDPRVRQRMLASAGTYFEKEVGRFDTYLPEDRRSLRSRRRCRSWSAREASPTSLRLPGVSPSA
jgi:pimeloyl-ACP methyl ester carboxylesterase